MAAFTDECWIANATFVNGTRAGSMYIMDRADYTVGIIPDVRRVNVKWCTVSGFALFATQLVFNNNTLLEAQFWAKSTIRTAIYGLTWKLDDDKPNGDCPVVVKASERST